AELKERSAKLRNALRGHLYELKEVSIELKKSQPIRIHMSLDEIKQRIEQLEWTIMTTPYLDQRDEEKMVNEIANLERIFKTVTTNQKRYSELIQRYDEIRGAVDSVKEELSRVSRELNECRNSIALAKEERNRIKQTIADLIKEIVEIKNRRDSIK
ncbi:MAG: hypothetical protein QXX37_07770, partial [Ignisphaera sp.]